MLETSALSLALFFLKALIIVVALLVIFANLVAIATKNKLKDKGKLKITKLNEKYDTLREDLREKTFSKRELKKALKSSKKEKVTPEHRLFVLEFIGDIKANAVEQLREEITAILTIATPQDAVVLLLESGGGLVNSYGLAASQLQRLRDQGIPLTVIVDKIAASGGYLMACVANEIYAAPFAIIGSIGVLAQIPNFHRFLKDKKIDFEQITAGEYKRTLTLFGENTDKDREKMKHDITDIHNLFKEFILKHRPQLNIDQVATGEYWLGTRAYELRLVDKLITSDDYLLSMSSKKNIYRLSQVQKKSLGDRLGKTAQLFVRKAITGLQEENNSSRV